MLTLKLGIVGCRYYTDYENFRYIVDDYLNGLYCNSMQYIDLWPHFTLEIISGGAEGIDTLAEKYANDNKFPFKKYDAKWYGENGKGTYNKDAGTDRNALIVKECNYVLALPSKTSIGTYDTIRKAKNAKLHVTVIDLPEQSI
jgi:hypothetical protein